MAAPEVKSIKTTRASSKRRITNAVKQAHVLLSAGNGIPSVEYEELAEYIKSELHMIENLSEKLIDLELSESETDPETITIHEKYISDINEGALPVMYKLVKRAAETAEAKSSKHVSEVKCRVERLKFPIFTGDMQDYGRFKKHFTHFAKDLSETETFYQLVNCMQGDREKKRIKDAHDLKRAWEILDEAYGDPDLILDRALSDIERAKPYAIRGKLSEMERFYEAVQHFETIVDTMELSGDLNNRVVVNQIRRKLPEEHRLLLIKSVRDGETPDNLHGLVRWLHSQLMIVTKARDTDEGQSQKLNKTQSVSNSAMFPGVPKSSGASGLPPKCPIHPNVSNHFLKGCYKFRKLPQSENFKIMKTNAICFRCGHNNCVAGKHPFRHDDCQFIAKCQVQTCGRDTHFASICPVVYGFDGYINSDKRLCTQPLSHDAPPFTPKNSNPSTCAGSHTKKDGELTCVLPTLLAYIHHGSKKTMVRILLDQGSQVSLIREGIIPRSQDHSMQDFQITTVGGNTIQQRLRVADCTIESLDGDVVRQVLLTELSKPCGNTPIITNSQIRQYSHLRNANIMIEEAPNETIDVLLGVDNTDLISPEESVSGTNTEDPIAARCPLGWYIQGGRTTNKPMSNALLNYVQICHAGELEEFLGIERMGLEPTHCKCAEDQRDKEATDLMQQSVTQLQDGTYRISLPWKKSPDDLPNNYTYAVNRLINLEKQFRNRPDEWEVYCNQMRDQVARGVAREVSSADYEDEIRQGKKMWFLPHFAVAKDSNTTPVRVVFDGKARYQGHSLNDYLAKGENVNTSLFDVALRFRQYEVGVVADISKMFQAVKITRDDARFHRYLFRERPDEPIKVYELTTVTFGDKPSPTAAIVTLRHVVTENTPEDHDLRRIIHDQFYVDDLSESKRTIDDVARLKIELTGILQKGNFNIQMVVECQTDMRSRFLPHRRHHGCSWDSMES